MIWLRRFLTVPLGLVLLLLLFVALVLLQVGDTFLDPGYYTKELKKANFYEFALVDVTTSALNEARRLDASSFHEDLEENPLVTAGLSTEEIVSSLNRAVPPDWVQGLVEQVFDEVGRYLTGDQDEFQVTIEAGDQVVAIVEEIKFLLRKADAYNLLYEELVTPAIEDAVTQELPFGLEISGQRLVESAGRIAPPEWVQTQVEAVLDEVTPYFVGDRDSFEIVVELSDRAEMALDEVKRLMRDIEAIELLYDEVIEPELADFVGDGLEVPFGFSVTKDEVMSALRQVAPPDWVLEQAELVIDQASPYITGKTDKLAITISIADNKRDARDILVSLAKTKFGQVIDELPGCTAGQVPSLGSSGIPDCIPQGFQPAAFPDERSEEVARIVDRFVLGQIPDDLEFTDSQLRQTLRLAGAEENIDLLDDVRELIRDGWTYTEHDLRSDIRKGFADTGEADDAIELLDDVRAFLADGWTYTEQDLREHIVEFGEESDLEDLDDVRKYLGRAQTYSLLVYLPVLLLLILIGFLGGRHWSSRFAWASAFLLLPSIVILVVSGPVYNSVAKPLLDDAQEEAIEEIEFDADFEQTQRLATNKGFEILRSAVNGFASGVAGKTRILLIVGIVGLALSAGWGNIIELMARRRPPEPAPPEPPREEPAAEEPTPKEPEEPQREGPADEEPGAEEPAEEEPAPEEADEGSPDQLPEQRSEEEPRS